MLETSLVVSNDVGLHARPAALFVALASKYLSSIWVKKGGTETWVDAKSILSVLMLGVESGQTIEIRAEGEDEAQAVTALSDLVITQFPGNA